MQQAGNRGGDLSGRCRLIKRLIVFIAALALGVGNLWIAAGSPAEVAEGGIMMDTDYPNAAAAFELFVRGDWHWPLGKNPDFGDVNIFYSDAAPWYALLAKCIYNSTGFFSGFHLLVIINFILFSLMARRLSEEIFEHEAARWLNTALLTFSLIMPVRLIGAQHVALSSYWVVMWAMIAVPLDEKGAGRLRRWEFLAALGVAVLSHAYLGAMAVVIVGVALVFKRRWAALAFALAWPVFLIFVIGAFQGPHAAAGGAKLFSLDLLAFGQSLNWGLVPNLYDIPLPQQSDAILYLGTGCWLMIFIVIGACLRDGIFPSETVKFRQFNMKFWRMRVIFVASILLLFYAAAFNLRFAGHLAMSIPIPSLLEPLYEKFRATGRFAAPMAYWLITSAVLWWRPRLYCRKAGWCIIGALIVCLQISDCIHAGMLRPSAEQLASKHRQQAAVESLLKGKNWSGHVFKDVGYSELKKQRLLDQLLVDYGAARFEVVCGARLDPRKVKRRSGYEGASPGDIVILRADASRPPHRDHVIIKNFAVCLL